MDEEKKKLLNICICTLRDFCKEQDDCKECPIGNQCDCRNLPIPCNWRELK